VNPMEALGWEIALPVIGRDDSAVVDVLVTDAELTRGVLSAWVLLGVLGVVLVGAAVLVADRLGAGLVRPIKELANAARGMSEGNLEARVEPSEPEEIRDVGGAFNQLANRLDQLLMEERESVAELSHRLRTPMASLRLQVEKVSDMKDREQVLSSWTGSSSRSTSSLSQPGPAPVPNWDAVSSTLSWKTGQPSGGYSPRRKEGRLKSKPEPKVSSSVCPGTRSRR